MIKISFIGSGNVASHLSKAFKKAGLEIQSISSKNQQDAKSLAETVGAIVCPINDINPNIDLLIVSVYDDAIADVLASLPKEINAVVHSSGGVSIDVFQNRFKNYGVFYPLQSFNKNRAIDFTDLPILIEANRGSFENDLLKLTVTNPYEKDMQPPQGSGFGLSGLKRRLYLLFARNDLLHVNNTDTIFSVMLKIPNRV